MIFSGAEPRDGSIESLDSNIKELLNGLRKYSRRQKHVPMVSWGSLARPDRHHHLLRDIPSPTAIAPCALSGLKTRTRPAVTIHTTALSPAIEVVCALTDQVSVRILPADNLHSALWACNVPCPLERSTHDIRYIATRCMGEPCS